MDINLKRRTTMTMIIIYTAMLLSFGALELRGNLDS